MPYCVFKDQFWNTCMMNVSQDVLNFHAKIETSSVLCNTKINVE